MKQSITIEWENSLQFNEFFLLENHVVFYISKVVAEKEPQSQIHLNVFCI